MRMAHFVGTLALAVLAGACAGARVEPTLAADADKRIPTYRTYRWLAGGTPPGEEYPSASTALQQAGDRELESKGYRRVDQGTVDFVVRPHLDVEEKTEIRTVDPSRNEYVWDPYFGPSVGGSGGDIDPEDEIHWQEGTVGVDVLDARTGRVEWTARLRADLGEDPSDEELAHQVDDAMTRLFAELPGRR
ncbi:MAG: DUF4136 domain-containing protein [Myxococcales bacterium]